MSEYSVTLSFENLEAIREFIKVSSKSFDRIGLSLYKLLQSLSSDIERFVDDPEKYEELLNLNEQEVQDKIFLLTQNLRNMKDIRQSFIEITNSKSAPVQGTS